MITAAADHHREQITTDLEGDSCSVQRLPSPASASMLPGERGRDRGDGYVETCVCVVMVEVRRDFATTSTELGLRVIEYIESGRVHF